MSQFKELTRAYKSERHIIGHAAHSRVDASAERHGGGQRGRDLTVEEGERAGNSGGDARGSDLASGAPGLASGGRAVAAAMRSIQEKSALREMCNMSVDNTPCLGEMKQSLQQAFFLSLLKHE